jgi:hypothetical protein
MIGFGLYFLLGCCLVISNWVVVWNIITMLLYQGDWLERTILATKHGCTTAVQQQSAFFVVLSVRNRVNILLHGGCQLLFMFQLFSA